MPRFAIPLLLLFALRAAGTEPRVTIPLDGEWRFRRDGSDMWKSVAVPSPYQDHEGTSWHGVGWYERTVDVPEVPASKRILVHFDAAATHATIFWDDAQVGEHLGGWTAFRIDVTARATKGRHTLRVRVDEKVGHNTQGFLPIIQPHFGGLWKSVSLGIVPERYVDEMNVLAVGDLATGEILVRAGIGGNPDPNSVPQLRVRYRLRGATDWQSGREAIIDTNGPIGVVGFRIRVTDAKAWSPETPHLYEIELSRGDDRVVVRAAFRTVATKGHQLLLNGQPLIVRGVLNWGYEPPRLAPNCPPDVWRKEIEFAKSYGFNLMKFCLWLPPKEYLDLCDELGLLAWVEYPTWHPKLDASHRGELAKEFAEFFAHDRNHPSVVLRSLTCETGPSADVEVIRGLYDLAKKMIPGCVVEDDSSWIEWNRVHDFYDDHPYGNNHTWPATLKRLTEYIAKREAKPLLLGEAIAADTWVDPESPAVNALPPWARPGFLDGNRKWLARMRELYGPGGLDRLGADSREQAILTRRYQIETFRREVPSGGYVVSVLRDFPLAGMGLIGYDGKPKWARDEWDWHGRDDEPRTKSSLPRGLTILPVPANVTVARRFDAKLLDALEAGGKVLLLPDGKPGSFPLRAHWFLRGGLYMPDHPVWSKMSRGAMSALQQFDLAGDVIPDVTYLDQIDPIALLWDNHDIKEVQTHALAFSTRVGKGRLYVSALNHDTPYGKWLLGTFAHWLANGPEPKRALSPESRRHLREKLSERKIDLTPDPWRFRPDPKNDGLANGWHKRETPTTDGWSEIRVGKAWEAQGWATLDGWAWYRREVTIPKDWAGRDVYVTLEGADDHYELYVNGVKVGAGGDIAARRTAFDEKASHKVTAQVKPGEPTTLAVRVFDWYGAGGLHRPVAIGTAAFNPAGEIIR